MNEDLADNLVLRLNETVSDLDEVSADAVFVATGSGGDRFGLDDGFDPVSLSTARAGTFLSSPDFEGASVLAPFREGMRVANAIESFLKVGRMEGDAGRRTSDPSKLFVDTSKAVLSPLEKPAGTVYTQDEAVKEAGRCLLCECRSCMDHCELLTAYKKDPHKVLEDVVATLNAVSSLTTHLASREINSCNLCGLCKEICPTDLISKRSFWKAGANCIRTRRFRRRFTTSG
jgi:ferredoxin